jgi:hypothetical protein
MKREHSAERPERDQRGTRYLFKEGPAMDANKARFPLLRKVLKTIDLAISLWIRRMTEAVSSRLYLIPR